MRSCLVIKLLTVSLLFSFPGATRSARAQDIHPPQHTHQHDPAEKLGRVNFTVSCNLERKTFQPRRRLATFFQYEEAEKAFNEVTVTDPRCAWVTGHRHEQVPLNLDTAQRD